MKGATRGAAASPDLQSQLRKGVGVLSSKPSRSEPAQKASGSSRVGLLLWSTVRLCCATAQGKTTKQGQTVKILISEILRGDLKMYCLARLMLQRFQILVALLFFAFRFWREICASLASHCQSHSQLLFGTDEDAPRYFGLAEDFVDLEEDVNAAEAFAGSNACETVTLEIAETHMPLLQAFQEEHAAFEEEYMELNSASIMYASHISTKLPNSFRSLYSTDACRNMPCLMLRAHCKAIVFAKMSACISTSRSNLIPAALQEWKS